MCAHLHITAGDELSYAGRLVFEHSCAFCVSVCFMQSWILAFPKHSGKIDRPNLDDSQEDIDCVYDLILSSEGRNVVTNCSYSPYYNSSAHTDSGKAHCHGV